jgi:hypothetical protein
MLALKASALQIEKGTINYNTWAMYIHQTITTYNAYAALYLRSLQDYTELKMINNEL